jgi:hypothetical protein
VSDSGYSIEIDELVVEHGPANVDDLTREVEVELGRLLAAPAETTAPPSQTNAQRIARMLHTTLQERHPR